MPKDESPYPKINTWLNGARLVMYISVTLVSATAFILQSGPKPRVGDDYVHVDNFKEHVIEFDNLVKEFHDHRMVEVAAIAQISTQIKNVHDDLKYLVERVDNQTSR